MTSRGDACIAPAFVFVVTLLLAAGCVSMSDRDRGEYARMAREGRRADDGEHLGPTLALNVVLPGAGHYYLGYYVEGTGLLLSNVIWPWSIVLALPASIQDTRTYNRQKAVDEDLTRQALEQQPGESRP